MLNIIYVHVFFYKHELNEFNVIRFIVNIANDEGYRNFTALIFYDFFSHFLINIEHIISIIYFFLISYVHKENNEKKI